MATYDSATNIKRILVISNILVMLLGLLLIIVGGVAAGGQVNELTSTTLASGIIVLGVLVMLTAVIGYWGALKESKAFLYTFFGLLVFFALVEFAVGIAAFVKKDDLPDYANQLWNNLYAYDQATINDIETNFKCCGWYNLSDRAIPPYSTETSCISLYPGVPSCSFWWLENLELRYGNTPAGRLALQNYQIQNQCCGWDTKDTPSFFHPWSYNGTDTCAGVNPTFFKTCYQALQDLWYANYKSTSVQGDAWIVAQQSYWFPNSCCGWQTVSDSAIPPVTSNTCTATKSFFVPCSAAVDNTLAASLQTTGGIGIAVAVLQIAVIILTLVFIIKIPARKRNDSHTQELREDD